MLTYLRFCVLLWLVWIFRFETLVEELDMFSAVMQKRRAEFNQ